MKETIKERMEIPRKVQEKPDSDGSTSPLSKNKQVAFSNPREISPPHFGVNNKIKDEESNIDSDLNVRCNPHLNKFIDTVGKLAQKGHFKPNYIGNAQIDIFKEIYNKLLHTYEAIKDEILVNEEVKEDDQNSLKNTTFSVKMPLSQIEEKSNNEDIYFIEKQEDEYELELVIELECLEQIKNDQGVKGN